MKKRFTRQQHIELGQKLIRINHEIRTAYITLAKAYPHSSSEVKNIIKTEKSISNLRCVLDDAFCREGYKMPGSQISPYYGETEK